MSWGEYVPKGSLTEMLNSKSFAIVLVSHFYYISMFHTYSYTIKHTYIWMLPPAKVRSSWLTWRMVDHLQKHERVDYLMISHCSSPCLADILWLRWPKRLGGRIQLPIRTTIRHAFIAKYVLALNRGKPEVPYKTLRSFGKYLEMWKFP